MVTVGAWNEAAATAAVLVATVTALAMEYEARMRSDEMAMRFSCRQQAMQMRRLDSRMWQKCVASGTEEVPALDAEEAAELPVALVALLLLKPPAIIRASAEDATL